MATLHIPCPKCGKELKLRDRSLLGKKGRCPSCQHTFVLDEPDEVQLELAEAAPAAGPLMGTAARWVPDAAPSPFSNVAVPAAPSASPPAGSFEAIGGAAPFGVGLDESPADRAREAARRKAARRRTGMMVGAVVATVVVGAGLAFYALNNAPAQGGRAAGGNGSAENGDQSDGGAMANDEPLPKGEPITLHMAPLGARFVINLRPAELWQKDSHGEEFRYCLGPLGEWLEGKIKELTKYEPADIEEILFCVIPNAPGDPASFAGVVHLKEERKRSEMITKFQGEVKQEGGYPVYVGPVWAYAIMPDSKKTFAFCASASVQEMLAAVSEPSTTDEGIEELLRKTDRSRHLTIVFRPDEARTHHAALFPQNAVPFANQVIDWFNPDEIDVVAWSLHLGEKRMRSEFQIRNKTTRAVGSLEKDFHKRLERLPDEVLQAVQMMEPGELGKRKLIGRLPAMLAIVANETAVTPATRLLTLSTDLPERGAPNLALGALLAWDESTRTDFNRTKTPSGTKPTGPTPTGGDGLLAKLNRAIEIDFRKMPLQDAFAYIANETGTTIDIDGDGLKLSGYTKNMEQNMQLGMVSGLAAMKEILARYKDMCVLMDEQKKVALVTTKAVAQQKGLKPHDFSK